MYDAAKSYFFDEIVPILNQFVNGTLANGTLYQNFDIADESDGILPWYFPHAGGDTGANITFFANRTVGLNFADTGENLFLSLSIFSALFDPEKKLLSASCVYPLSGQYSHLPRMLFYCAIAFAVLFRHRTWLAEAALGIAMTYSACSSIHLFALLTLYKFGVPTDDVGIPIPNASKATDYGDVDFWGIAPVIATSAIAIIPMLHWSSSFQRKSAKVVIAYWALLIFVAFAIVCYYVFSWSHTWFLDIVPTVAVCNRQCPGSDVAGVPTMATLEDYYSSDCQCSDFCGYFAPTAPLRRRQSMVTQLPYKVAQEAYCHDPGCFNPKKGAIMLQNVVFALWLVALFEGLLALPSIVSGSRGTRNRVFRAFSSGRRDIIYTLFKGRRRESMLKRFEVLQEPNLNTRFRRTRRWLAKFIAANYYLSAVFSVVNSPLLFIISIVMTELFLGTISTSERSDSIGSWGPWVVAFFGIGAAIFMRHQETLFHKPFRMAYHLIHFIQYDAGDRPPVEGQKHALLPGIWSGARHAWFVFRLGQWKAWIRFKLYTQEFIDWWKDPERVSYEELDDFNDDTKGADSVEKLTKYKIKTNLRRPTCTCTTCEQKKWEPVQSEDDQEKDDDRHVTHAHHARESHDILLSDRPSRAHQSNS